MSTSAKLLCPSGMQNMAFLSLEEGSVSLCGTSVDLAAAQSSLSRHRITLFSQQELIARNIDAEEFVRDPSTDLRFVNLGTGGQCDVSFKVIVWPGGMHARKAYGLPPTHFHIMLSQTDDPLIDKGPNSVQRFEHLSEADLSFLLQVGSECEDLLKVLYGYQPCERLFDAVCAPSDCAFMLETAQEHADWCVPFMKLGWFYYKHFYNKSTGYKCAMVYLLIARLRASSATVTSVIDELLQKVSKHTEWGLVCTEEETNAFNADYIAPQFLRELLRARPLSLALSKFYRPELQLDSYTLLLCLTNVEHVKGCFELANLPRFFRWVLPFDLAVMSRPRNIEDIRMLASAPLLFDKIVTLTEEMPLRSEWFQGMSLENVFLPVTDYGAPTRPQVDHFIDLVVAGHRTLLHCAGGKGRSGTFIACYLAACGFTRKRQEYPVFCASEVIGLVRHFRPGSIETAVQERFVDFYIANYGNSRMHHVA